MILCVIPSISHSQIKEHKDLNSPERVEALYKINEQFKAKKKQLADCQQKYSEEIGKITKSMDSITKIAVAMNLESKEFVSHNQDLQAGLLGLIDENHKLDLKVESLEATVKKYFTVGIQVGATYDFASEKIRPYAGIGVSRTIFRF